MRKLTKESKKKAWTETVENIDLNKESHKAWKLLNNLEGKSSKKNPEPLQCEGGMETDTKKKADIFNKHYANVNRSLKREPLDSVLMKQLKNKQETSAANITIFDDDFKLSEMETAMKKLACRKSPGPDGIKNEMICHLGHLGKKKLLQFINRTWKENKMPKEWLTAKIIPILKQGKIAGQPKSYRPISLTSCVGKLAERMVNNRLYWWLEKNKILNDSQAGFRKGCRTEDQLFRLVQNTIDGFQKKRHTSAVFIDLQQAYDRVWRKGLILKMTKMGITGNMLKWIQAFLKERTITTEIDGISSSKRTLEEGLPQGSALSCTLFLIFINDITNCLTVSRALFADDLVIWTTANNPMLAESKLNKELMTISTYCKFWKLKINTQKTVYSVFSLSPKAAKRPLSLKIDGESISKEENPIYLGVQLDKRMTLSEHINNLREKANKRLNIIKRLASTTWGADKRTLRQLYIGYVRSAMDYGLPLQTIASKEQLQTLERLQNQALRLICGGMKSTPIAACEIDANIEPYDIRRKRALIDATERYNRQEESHPNRIMVNTWKREKRIQRKSLLEIATEIEQENHLPQNRENELKYSELPPWSNTLTPTVKTHLLDETANKEMPPNELRTSALETIDSFPRTAIHAYTDGSAFKTTNSAGLGVHIRYPDDSFLNLSLPCGNICSNYEAEILAIKTAIETIHQQFETNEKETSDIVVFTDSKSALESLENPHESCQKEIKHTARSIHNILDSFNTNIVLQWIPGHNNIPGYESADNLDKKGSSQVQFDKEATSEQQGRSLTFAVHRGSKTTQSVQKMLYFCLELWYRPLPPM